MINIDRREFLKLTGMATCTGLTIAVTGLSAGCSKVTDQMTQADNWPAWLHIDTNDEITIYCPRVELGQGTLTALAMVVADELDANWSMVKALPAPLDDQYGQQRTENSDGVRANWLTMRKLGAIARQQLLQAAAKHWQVSASECKTNVGKIMHAPSGREISYGQLVETAVTLPLPDNIHLKDKPQFKFLGHSAPRLDIPAMVNGSLQYTADIQLPGLLTATILHSPKLGGNVATINADATLATPGVKTIVNLGNAVAVVAEDYWSAQKGLQALSVYWTAADTPALDDDAMWQLFKTEIQKRGTSVYSQGNIDDIFMNNDKVITQEYSLPYYAHACMETMTCVADVKGGSCEIWAPTQNPWATYHTALNHGLSSFAWLRERVWLKLTARASDRIKIHPMPVGGGFGRKLYQDCVKEAILISKSVKAPVKLIWSREEDIKSDLFQPASLHRLQARLNDQAQLTSWYHRIAGSGILSHETSFPYRCDNVGIEVSDHHIGVPTGSWRSVSDTPHAYARENFINHICQIQNKDPVDYRLAILVSPRMKKTLEVAAKATNWYKKSNDIARGVALHESRGSFVAQIVELKLQGEQPPKIHRVICAIDCGLAVNPDGIKAQMEGSIVFGLSTILSKGIQVQNGEIVQSNFHDFKILRLQQTPSIEVYIVDSADAPGGVGEPGVPPLAPAVYGALMGLSELGKLQH